MKFIILLFLLFPGFVFCQYTLEPDQPIKILINSEGKADLLIADPENERAFGQFGYITETYVTFKGTPYFNDGFSQGEITLENGEIFSGKMGLNLRDMSVYDENHKLLASGFKTLKIFGSTLIMDKTNGGNEKPMVLETIKKGDIEVIKSHEVNLITSTRDQSSRLLKNDQKYIGVFKKSENFILKISDRYVPVSHKLKFFASLGEYEQKAYQLMDKNQYDLRNEIEVLEFVNALTARSI
jgi:hypothetical protein